MLRLAVAYCNWHAGFFFFFLSRLKVVGVIVCCRKGHMQC